MSGETETRSSHETITLAFCFLAALCEGYDLQVAGVTAPAFAKELGLHLGPILDFDSNLTWVLSVNTLGLLIGAAVGGRLADTLGRKWLLTGSMLAFAVFTLGTALASNYETMIVMRFLTGLGLGGAMPNIIALVSETGAVKMRAVKVTLVTGAMSAGGAVVSLFVYLSGQSFNWREAFYIGAAAPALVAVLMALFLPESSVFMKERAAAHKLVPTNQVLFGDGRGGATVLLWASYLFTLIVLYLLLNWLATLMNGKGYSASEATLATLFFGIGGAIGGWTLGLIGARGGRTLLVVFCYIGMAASVAALAYAPRDIIIACLASFGSGCFVIGTQFLLYGMAPEHYSAVMRATGIGWAVAIGRVGSFVGPLLPGIVGPGRVLFVLLPVIAVAGVAAASLSLKRGQH